MIGTTSKFRDGYSHQKKKLNLIDASLSFVFPSVFAIGAAAQTAAMGDLAPMYAGRVISGLGVGLSECHEVTSLDLDFASHSDFPFLRSVYRLPNLRG